MIYRTVPIRAALMVSVLAGIASTVQAAVTVIPQSALTPTTQYYTEQIGIGIGSPLLMTGGGNSPNVGGSTNDDGFSGPIPLGFTLNFFGVNYTTFFANNNGNISFGSGIPAFTPAGPQGAAQPIISPFFGDVDTRGVGSGLMNLNTSIPNQIIVTWDQVGYFNSHTDKVDSFQLVLRGPAYTIPVGEGSIGFFWKGMQWETGDASGGTAGFGGTPAAVGFGDGLLNGEILEGSTQNGIAAVVANHELWFDANLAPIPVAATPEPASLSLLALGAAAILYRRRR